MTQHALDDLNEFSAHHLRLRLTKSLSPLSKRPTSTLLNHTEEQDGEFHSQWIGEAQDDSALVVRLQAHSSAHITQIELQPHSSTLDITYNPNHIPSLSSTSSSLANLIATKLQELFAEEQAIFAYILNQSRSLKPELAARLASRSTRSLKYAPTYHITISLFSPSASPSSWEIEAAISEYLAPLLNSISIVSNFTVDTQIQLFATFSPSVHSPEHDAEGGFWSLQEEDLSGFINAAEWPLSPSIGAGPTLNFVLYVPDPATSPLLVKGSQASSWLIPQWGGVAILNNQKTNGSQPTLSKEAIQPALLTFSHQLLSLLGAPQTPPSLPLQLKTLTRIRAASLLLSASSTMGSLANLTVALPSISIPETVSDAVDTTLHQLQSACDTLKEGKFEDALEHARTAEAEAESAFFEKSMVGQVYFPDEHKVAVYMPLLGPIGVALVMNALKELRRFWSTLQSKRQA